MSAGERKKVLTRIEAVLGSQPTRITRNLKLLRPNPLVHYEQRVGVLRVFFNVEERRASVLVLSVGRKEGAGLWIGGREVRI
ncbi:MAG: hypothetical protein AABY65_10580 [Nitrospirota bacterium]